MRSNLPQPGFLMCVALMLVVVALQGFLSIPLAILDLVAEHSAMGATELARNPLSVGFVNIFAFAGALALGLYIARESFSQTFVFRPGSFLSLVAIVPAVLGSGLLLSELDNAFRSVFPIPEWLMKLFKEIFFPDGHLFSNGLLLVVIAPVTEELLFRGLILRGLLRRHRPAVAVVLTALLFGAVHLNPWQFLSASALGLLLGWFYVRTGSVLPCIIGHAVSNGLSLLFSKLPLDIPGLSGVPDGTVEFQPWWVDVTGLALLLIGIWLFRKTSRKTAIAEQIRAPPVISEINQQG